MSPFKVTGSRHCSLCQEWTVWAWGLGQDQDYHILTPPWSPVALGTLSFWYTYTCATRPASLSLDTPHLLSRGCRAFPTLTHTRLWSTVPTPVFSEKGALSPTSKEGTNLFLRPCSFVTGRSSTVCKAGLPTAPSETRAHRGCLQLTSQLELLLTHKHKILLAADPVLSSPTPAQWASHPQISLLDML